METICVSGFTAYQQIADDDSDKNLPSRKEWAAKNTSKTMPKRGAPGGAIVTTIPYWSITTEKRLTEPTQLCNVPCSVVRHSKFFTKFDP